MQSFEQQWALVQQAPLIAISLALQIAFVVWAALSYLNRSGDEALNKQLALAKDQIAALEKRNSELEAKARLVGMPGEDVATLRLDVSELKRFHNNVADWAKRTEAQMKNA